MNCSSKASCNTQSSSQLCTNTQSTTTTKVLYETFLSHFSNPEELTLFLQSQQPAHTKPFSHRKLNTNELYNKLQISQSMRCSTKKKCQYPSCTTSTKQPYICDDKLYCAKHIREIASQKKQQTKVCCQHVFRSTDTTYAKQTCTLPCVSGSKFCIKHRKKSESN